MKGFEKAVEWLRVLVDINDWDYCVVWKLGDDPSRFIEWMGCCCSGGGSGGGGGGGGGVKVERVKEEEEEEEDLVPLCRDGHLKHIISSKACEALASFPSSMPLYSGVHGEVVITNQPRWVNNTNASDSNGTGTRVYIPVSGGLIELFSAKNIPKDEKMIEFVQSNANVGGVNGKEQVVLDDFFSENLENYLPTPAVEMSNFIPGMQPIYEGSCSDSNPSNEFNISFDFDFDYNIVQSEPMQQQQQSISISSGCDNSKLVSDNNNTEPTWKPPKEHYKSKNLVTERKRRSKIKDGLFTLRSLVPKISKMDKASILGDASEYILELQQEVKKLQDELKEMEVEDCLKENEELHSSKSIGLHEGNRSLPLPPTEINKSSSGCREKGNTEVYLEVNQMSQTGFLIKFFYEQKPGGFSRLMRAINSLGFQVVDANITTIDCKVLSILMVEANKKDIDIQPKILRDSLIKLTG